MVKKSEESTLAEQRKSDVAGSSLQRRKSPGRGRPSEPAPGMAQVAVPSIEAAMRRLYGSEPVIPSTRPVVGLDLDLLRTRLGGITVTDACWLFGLQRNRWYELVRSKEPLEDVTLAMMIRVYDMFPEMCPIKPVPKAEWVYHWLKEINPTLDQRTFSLLLGREKSAAHRWLKLGQSVSPKIERLFTTMQAMMIAQINPLKAMEPLVQIEASARGLDVNEGVWSTKDNRIKPQLAARGERLTPEERQLRKAMTPEELKARKKAMAQVKKDKKAELVEA